MDIYEIILSIHLVFCLIPAVVGIVRYRCLPKSLKVLVWLLWIVCLVETHGLYRTFISANSVWIYHFYIPLEYVLLVIVFSGLVGSARIRRVLRLSIFGFIVLSLISSIIMGKLTEYSYFPVTVAYIIYAGVTSYILFQLFKSDWGDIFKRPAFWISSALLAISSCNIIYVAFQDIINAYELVWPWVLHNIVNMIAYLMYAVGLYVSKCGAEESEMEISDAFPLLTSQQRKVYWRTKKGITREDDAKIFDINAVTVRKHIENIRRKLSSAKLEDPNP